MGKNKGHLVITDDPNDDVAIRVEGVSKTFRLPHNKQNSIKGSLINLFSGGGNTYETQEVLKEISFEIKKGEFFGIVGRNGSGKSTLLKMLAGIYTPSKGKIIINGSLTPFIELGVGFNPELTGRENVYLNGALLGFSSDEMSAMYGDIVAFAELERFMDQKLKNYSSGMQVRLAFSIAIRAQSDILVLDEVLAVGDAAFQQKCYEYFDVLKEQGKTVVLVSHDMTAVMRFCSKAMYIQAGAIIYEGATHKVADLYAAANQQPLNVRDHIDRHYNISAALVQGKKDTLKYTVNYVSDGKEDMYIGLTIFRNGVSVSELTTDPSKPLRGTGTAVLTFGTESFNAGEYRIGVALFHNQSRQLLAVYDEQDDFVVAGEDVTRGAAVRINGVWSI